MSDLIRTTAELEEACRCVRVDGVLSLDTEFVWMRTYRPQLGIVQMGGRKNCWAIDCTVVREIRFADSMPKP